MIATLGQGRYGVTYRARDPHLHLDVAIKEFLPITVARRQARRVVTPLSEHTLPLFHGGRTAFLAEAGRLAALGKMNTPAIAVRDVFEDNGTAYMVMTLVHGESLLARLRRERRLSRQVVERLLPPLLDGLAAAHGAGVVHADIVPAHILIDTAGRPTLIDFGAARLALADQVRAETGELTLGYAAPEVMVPAPPGASTDIYGLAATLYHCIAGVAPLSARERLVRDALVPATEIGRRGYGRSLLAAIDAGLKPVARERPPSIEAWRAMFDTSTAPPEDVNAAPPPVAEPVVRPSAARVVVVPRRRRATSVAAIGGALVATAIGVSPLIGNLVDGPRRVTRGTFADVQPTNAAPPAAQAAAAARVAPEDRQTPAAARQQTAAVEVDAARRAAAARRQAEDEAARRAAALERQQAEAADARRRQAEVEAARQAAEATRQAEDEAARRAAALERQQAEAAEARRRQADAEAARQAAEAQRRADDEAARRAAAEKAAEEKAAAERAAAEAARRVEEQARQQAEAQRQAQFAAAQAAQEARDKARLKAEAERYAESEARAIDADLAARRRSEVEVRARQERSARRQAATLALQGAREAARREAEAWPKTETEARRLGEAAEASLQLPELERKRVQAALSAAGHEIGATTGTFGPRTRAMIRAWQKQQGWPETGFITGLQLAALHLQLAPDLASDPSSTDQSAAAAGWRVDPRRAEADEAALGLTEADRKRAQMALTALGHEVVPITGFFGPRTRAMIAAWQKKQSVPETGFLTATQWTALQQQAVAAASKRQETPQPQADVAGAPVDARQAEAHETALGLTEADRKRAQTALTALGHDVAPITGFFGPRTRAMIAAWQKKQGLPETGYLSAAQWRALQQQAAPALAKLDAEQPKADIDRRQAEAEEAGLGLSEHDRKRVQVALSSLGHEIGATTGFIGPRTRAMITAWQRQQGLPETGYLSAAQWQALQRQAAPALAKYEAAQR